MKPLSLVLLLTILSSCAHVRGGPEQPESVRAELWHEAHQALYAYEFARADTLFSQLATEHANSTEGREAVFYIGSLHFDPRNPRWSAERTQTALRRYLQQDTVGTLIHRRPEAMSMLALARELTLPEDQRIAALQPRSPAAPTTQPEQPATPAGQVRILEEEIERLRRQAVQREERIRQQQEELERIRRVLTPPRTP